MNFLDLLPAYKTTLVGLGLVGYGVYLFTLNQMPQAYTAFAAGLGLIFGKHDLVTATAPDPSVTAVQAPK
jgi:hypothetical protein